MPSGKTKTQTTTQETRAQPWVEEQLKYGTQEARRIYDQGPAPFFPNQTFADFSPQTTQALNLTEARATRGNNAVNAGQNLLTDTIVGKYLGANPYLGAAMDVANRGTVRNFQEAVMPSVRGEFSRSGRYGSGAYANAASNAQKNVLEELGANNTRMSFANFDAERGRQMQAASMAPSFAAQDYIDLAQLGNVGAAYEDQKQKGIDEARARFDYAKNGGAMALDQFLQRVQGIAPAAGGLNITTQPVARANPFTQIAGLGLTAAGMFTGNPMMAMGPGMFGTTGTMAAPAGGIRWY